MEFLINVLPKYPKPDRFGPLVWADWYVQCRKAVELQKTIDARGDTSEILIVSDARYEGWRPEPEIYKEALEKLGAKRIRIDPDCYDTISQLLKALQIAKQEHKHLIVLATWMHYLRAEWILLGEDAELRVSYGIPLLWYAGMDVLLTMLVPLIDMIGLRSRYLAYAKKKRDAGKVY